METVNITIQEIIIMRQAEREQETLELMKIQKYANHYMYSDVHPFEVVKTISPICVEIRRMNTVQTKFPRQFTPGGFVGHFADNYGGQEYEYNSDPEAPVMRIRWSRAKRQWQGRGGRFIMEDHPNKFYDYNF